MKTDIFNFNRLGLLFKRLFAERSRYELILWITMIIVFMFLRNNLVGMTMAILISGVVYASNFYKDIHSQGNGAAYFMIPASQLEKTIMGVIMTSFYYFAGILIAYIIGNLLGTFLNNLLAGINILPGFFPFHHSSLQWQFFTGNSADQLVNITVNGESKFSNNLYNNHILNTFNVFLIGQSIYMLGSIYFKRNHFLATFLAVFVTLLLLSFLLVMELKLFWDTTSFQYRDVMSETGRYILKSLYWLLPPFFWVVSYFRLTEKQI